MAFALVAHQTGADWALIVAIGSFVILVGTLLYGIWKWDCRKKIRKALGDFLDEGLQLREQYAYGKEPPSEKKVKDWAARVETYLTEHCGKTYVSRFRSDAGLGTVGVHPDSNNLLYVYTRLSRLNEFIGEFRDCD